MLLLSRLIRLLVQVVLRYWIHALRVNIVSDVLSVRFLNKLSVLGGRVNIVFQFLRGLINVYGSLLLLYCSKLLG